MCGSNKAGYEACIDLSSPQDTQSTDFPPWGEEKEEVHLLQPMQLTYCMHPYAKQLFMKGGGDCRLLVKQTKTKTKNTSELASNCRHRTSSKVAEL